MSYRQRARGARSREEQLAAEALRAGHREAEARWTELSQSAMGRAWGGALPLLRGRLVVVAREALGARGVSGPGADLQALRVAIVATEQTLRAAESGAVHMAETIAGELHAGADQGASESLDTTRTAG